VGALPVCDTLDHTQWRNKAGLKLSQLRGGNSQGQDAGLSIHGNQDVRLLNQDGGPADLQLGHELRVSLAVCRKAALDANDTVHPGTAAKLGGKDFRQVAIKGVAGLHAGHVGAQAGLDFGLDACGKFGPCPGGFGRKLNARRVYLKARAGPQVVLHDPGQSHANGTTGGKCDRAPRAAGTPCPGQSHHAPGLEDQGAPGQCLKHAADHALEVQEGQKARARA